ncbi:MAG: hypothetical protein HY718_19025 [Planctomycetes bacterium]|nr:hypothetical protein [Planctomycetota bacterium]
MERHRIRPGVLIAWTVLALGAINQGTVADSPAVGQGVYRPDERFEEFSPLWREGWSWKDEGGERVRYGHPGMPLGGYLFAWFINDGPAPLTVDDVLLDGVSLAQGVPGETEPKVRGVDKVPSSIRFSKLPAGQIDRLIAAGTPVWWKVEPMVVPPGRMGEVTIRLRRDPKVKEVTIGVPIMTDKIVSARVRTDRRQPWFFSISFSARLDTVYAYLRHPSGKGVAPRAIRVDGEEVTRRCTIVADARVDTAAVVIRLDRPFERGSYHFFQADYDDGSTAVAGIGTWQLGFLYGMWGCDNSNGAPDQIGPRFLNDLALHNVNLHMSHCPGPAHEFMNTEAGWKMLADLGIGRMREWIEPEHRPAFYFLTDEPDAADFASQMLDPAERLGSLGQWLVDRCRLFRRKDKAATPLLLNVDNTFKPENWYMYAQLADIACADPYYQEAVQTVWAGDPTNLGAYLKPTYVYAVGTIYQSAAAPDPMHLILHTCRFDFGPEEFPYRGPTPQEKRVEVYYSVAAGAKQISYWWYCPYDRYHGVGAEDMEPLWTQIGLLGAEMRTAGPLIATGSPAAVPVKSPATVWCRTLLVGTDTVLLLVVNDNLASDRLGTVVRPREKTRVALSPPSWLTPSQVFEIDCDGTKDTTWTKTGEEVEVDLGRLDLTRMVVLTVDEGLRGRLQQDYDARFAANVRKLKTMTTK